MDKGQARKQQDFPKSMYYWIANLVVFPLLLSIFQNKKAISQTSELINNKGR